jgi:signal transduction histidine kinase
MTHDRQAMSARLTILLQPLSLAGLFTLLVVGVSLRWVPTEHAAAAWALLLGFSLLYVLHEVWLHDRPATHAPRVRLALLLGQALLALVLLWVAPRIGTPPILLVIWSALAVIAWPARWALAAVLLADAAAYAILLHGDHPAPLTAISLYAGFQGFAAMTTHYARSAEETRDRLAQVNADLLATRALLADSARDAERVRVARELHDVAGHKLTALSLNLHALSEDPTVAPRPQIALAHQLSRELLGDIRGVVQALRDSRGLDLATALHALAAPLPRPRLQLSIADDVQVTDPAAAETLLRLVQEALTNSARHAQAQTLSVRLQREGGALQLVMEDDGHLRGALREGNGLTGMRERIAQAGGRLALSTSACGGLRIDASLPA